MNKILVVDPEKRYTCEDILKHPFITKGEAKELSEEHDSQKIKRLKAFNARRKFRFVAHALVMASRFGKHVKQDVPLSASCKCGF